jgi:hypothetical protein
MLFLHDYIAQFRTAPPGPRRELAELLTQTKSAYDIFVEHGDPITAFEVFVERYNWLGINKAAYNISQNESRNLVGALMQDYLLHLVIKLCEPYPTLDVFTEVPVSFGRYPLWSAGQVQFSSPSEHSDLAVGCIIDAAGTIVPGAEPWPRQPYYRLPQGRSLFPLVTVNSKIRVSQSEFFDWLGREQLMTKGNPHCLSVQVALRKEMDMSIVQAAQAGDKFFLLGTGGERNVVPNRSELERFCHSVAEHLQERMT